MGDSSVDRNGSFLEVVDKVTEVRIHGRGGQGAVTAASLLVSAAVLEGKWGQAIPLFGAERRGAHVYAFARIAPKPVPLHSQVRRPSVVVVLDPSLIAVATDRVLVGVRPGGAVVANLPPKKARQLLPKVVESGLKLYVVDATSIAEELGLVFAGWPAVNTAMLGALVRATGIVSLSSIEKAIRLQWRHNERLAEANAEAARKAYAGTVQLKGEAEVVVR
ncbi:MAG: 2-oxoacid:acceptor oxidoreductase family protein [Thermoproteota archaeon]